MHSVLRRANPVFLWFWSQLDPRINRVTDWTTDSYARGSYRFMPIHASEADVINLAKPMAEGRILFAGEATPKDVYQTAHGALLSGLREAYRLGVRTHQILGLTVY